MYTESDYQNTDKQFQIRLGINITLLLVTIALLVVALVIRSRWMAIAVTVVGAWMTYAFLSLKTMPWYRYKKFLRDVKEGLNRETDGWFVSISEEARLADGVQVHDFIIRVGDKEEDQRLFFWDDEKPAPEFTEGQRVHIRSFGNYILEMNPV